MEKNSLLEECLSQREEPGLWITEAMEKQNSELRSRENEWS